MARVVITLLDNEEDNLLDLDVEFDPEPTEAQLDAGELTQAQAVALIFLSNITGAAEEAGKLILGDDVPAEEGVEDAG